MRFPFLGSLKYLLSAFSLIVDIECHSRNNDDDDQEDWDEDGSRGRGFSDANLVFPDIAKLSYETLATVAKSIVISHTSSPILAWTYQWLSLKQKIFEFCDHDIFNEIKVVRNAGS